MLQIMRKTRDYLHQKRDEILFRTYRGISRIHVGKYRSRKIILFRLDLIGDCTMFTSAARAIRQFYADREMTVVCLSISRPIFERLGIFDHIISVDFRPHAIDYRKLRGVIREVRRETYDILLQPQTSKLPLADILGAAVKCNRRIAIETKVGNSTAEWVELVNPLYDERIPYPRGDVSEFDYYGAFVRGLGLRDYRTTCPSLPYSEQSPIPGDYYVLYPGGSFCQKSWPAERFARVAEHLYKKTGMTGVILGTASEKGIAQRLMNSLEFPASMGVLDMMGQTTIEQVIDIIGNAKLVVTNDTSGVHIACATRTPSVAVVGGWHFNRFLPYHIEDVKLEDQLPRAVYTEMPCYHCDLDWAEIGRRRESCLRRIEREQTCDCIDGITVEQMCECIDHIIL